MNHNPYFNWSFNVWPDNFRTSRGGFWGHSINALSATSKDQMRYQAFAIGFFGFHYIRAVNENEKLLQKESLQILKRLVNASNLDTEMMKKLHISEKQSYIDYWDNKLIKISLILGDFHGPQIQYGVKLSFWLAALYSHLYGVLLEKNMKQVKAYLSVLENWISDLLVSAKQAEMPQKTLTLLVDLAKLLQASKTYPTACQCKRILELVIRDLLFPRS